MLNVVYEDNHIIVVEKPFNMPTQEDESKDRDLLTEVKDYVKVKYDKPGEVYIGLVHRLDRVAGGLMVFARTSKAASRLSEQIRNREFHKEYVTVVEGQIRSEKSQLVDYLKKDKDTNTVQVVNKNVKDAKEAILKYERIESKDNLTLLSVDLLTGRPHQIRVQFSSRKNPIWGDGKYGSSYKSRKGIALWSRKIEFMHPTKKTKMTFMLEPPLVEPWDKFKVNRKMD